MRIRTLMLLIIDSWLPFSNRKKISRKENKELTQLLQETLKKPLNVTFKDRYIIKIKKEAFWIGTPFYSYGNVWGTRQNKQPSLKNKWLLYRVVLRHEKLRKKMIRRF